MTRVLALADQSKIGCITQRRFAKVGTKTHPQRGAALDRNGLSVSTETACRFEPKSPVGNSEICSGGAIALVIVCHGGAAPLLHRQSGLGAVERLDLALLVDAEDHGMGRRIDVEANDILELLGEFGVVGELECAHPMRLKPVPLPD